MPIMSSGLYDALMASMSAVDAGALDEVFGRKPAGASPFGAAVSDLPIAVFVLVSFSSDFLSAFSAFF